MEITGRLTDDAVIRKTKTNKEFTCFTLAVNDSYKSKDGEVKETSEFFNCTYWLSTKVAGTLRKSSIVTVSGRVFLNEYTGKDGNKYASLAFHVNSLKIISSPKSQGAGKGNMLQAVTAQKSETDDLPF